MTAFRPPRSAAGDLLHVYLEGDGTPWTGAGVPAADPTPHDPLMLRLIGLDPAPSLYLARPCYDRHREDPGCAPDLWTDRRYGPVVVGALDQALRAFAAAHGYRGVVLLGHSGGGTLAMLLAARLPGVRAVVTIAANADIDLWADQHDYPRLAGSLNPVRDGPARVPEWHWLGGQDRQVPAQQMFPVLARRSCARVNVAADFDHRCCWESLWPRVLRELSHLSNTAMVAGHSNSPCPSREHR